MSSEQFFSQLEQIPMGRDSLKKVRELGFDVRFEKGLSDAGCCDAAKKVILLNPAVKPVELMSVFVHEARHASQSAVLTVNDEKTRTADMISAYKAMEADAVAHEAAFVYQAQEAGFNLRPSASVAAAYGVYRKTVEKGTDRAMDAAFRTWYTDTQTQNMYDDFYARQIVVIAGKCAAKQEKDCFSESLPAAEIVKVCPYINPDFLKSPEAFSIRSNAKETITDAVERYAGKTGSRADTSVKTMYSRAKNGKIIDDREFSAPSAAAVVKMKRDGR